MLSPPASPFESPTVAIFTFEGELLTNERVYLDLASLLQPDRTPRPSGRQLTAAIGATEPLTTHRTPNCPPALLAARLDRRACQCDLTQRRPMIGSLPVKYTVSWTYLLPVVPRSFSLVARQGVS